MFLVEAILHVWKPKLKTRNQNTCNLNDKNHWAILDSNLWAHQCSLPLVTNISTKRSWQTDARKYVEDMSTYGIQAMFRKSMNFWSTGDTMLNFTSMLKCKTVNFWWLVPNLEHQPSQAGRPGLLAQNWAQWHLISGPTPDIWHRFHIRWWNQLVITLQTHATSIKQKNGRHACGQVGCM
jgi:hypothetical protein